MAIGMPDVISQIRLIRKLNVPPPYSTSFPKGKKASLANLKHCVPTGMPTIVIHQSMPYTANTNPATIPPSKNQSKFPISFITDHLISLKKQRPGL